FLYSYAYHRALHSFPTRRSSDLTVGKGGVEQVVALHGGLSHALGAPCEKIQSDRVAVECRGDGGAQREGVGSGLDEAGAGRGVLDRKSTRLNSSHVSISYAVFCL